MELDLHSIASKLLAELELEIEQHKHRAEGVVLLYERIRDEIRQRAESGKQAAEKEQVSSEAAANPGTAN